MNGVEKSSRIARSTLPRFDARELIDDGMYYDAVRELNETARVVLAPQLGHLLGWDWLHVMWDQHAVSPDRIHAVNFAGDTIMGRNQTTHRGSHSVPHWPRATYERGMLTELRLPLGRWREVAGTVLAVCPLKRVEVLDVPGLTFEVLGPDACHTGDGWRMAAELKLPRRLHVLPAHFPPSFGLPAACYRRVWPDLKHLPHGYTRRACGPWRTPRSAFWSPTWRPVPGCGGPARCPATRWHPAPTLSFRPTP
jgi:hypothetical protein